MDPYWDVFFFKGKEAPPVSTHGTPPKTKMEPTKNPPIKMEGHLPNLPGFGFHMFPCEFSRAFIDSKRYRFTLVQRMVFASSFRTTLASPWEVVFPASGDTHFHPFFFGQNGCVILSGSRRGTWISFLVGGRTNDTNAHSFIASSHGRGGNISKIWATFLSDNVFFFGSMRFLSPQKMLEFFRAPVTRCSERAGRMVQHLPPQASYASVVWVASVLSAPGWSRN